MLTSEQREAAIERMAGAMSHDAKTEAEELADVGHALDALLENHVVLHRDDVTEEYAQQIDYGPERVTPPYGISSRRNVHHNVRSSRHPLEAEYRCLTFSPQRSGTGSTPR